MDSRWHEGKANGEVSRATIEGLLGYFLSTGLGLELQSPILKACDVPSCHQSRADSARSGTGVWAAWHTDRGVASAWGTYDFSQSQRLHAHVLLIEWWIGTSVHHEGWWRSDPKRPREWTKGRG